MAQSFSLLLSLSGAARRRVTIVALCAIAGLVAMNFLAYALRDRLPAGVPAVALQKFLLDGEQNVPTWFSSMLLFTTAQLLCVIGITAHAQQRRFAWHWLALAGIFAFMSMDEVSAFHELLIVPVREWLHLGGVFYFAWVLPAMVLCAILAIIYLPLVRSLPAQFRWGVVLAGAIYLAGAIGMELIGGAIADSYGLPNFAYFLSTTIEETLELLGIVGFIHVLIWQVSQPSAETASAVEPPSERVRPYSHPRKSN
ncbi:MAG: hypothetical protein L0H63_05935 [Nitrococcus sp.]|nr:hypothetical protein [Nitrococcus sp.]